MQNLNSAFAATNNQLARLWIALRQIFETTTT
jgi:hypothetical protein